MSHYSLHPQLANDTIRLGCLGLCEVLLMNDSQYPWLILVPQRPDIREVYQLSDDEQQQLWQEVNHCGQRLMALCNGFKLNIAALGNMVPQLHIHVIARQADDPAWPGPVWGASPAVAYSKTKLTAITDQLQSILQLEP